MQKRILVISDISCVGKCSLTVALPVLSACGHECVILPTAILSTHTAADFGDYSCRDLTDQLPPIVEHWKRLGLHFDAIFVGYLTSAHQARLVATLIGELKSPDTLLIVDPILGDNGQLYRGLGEDNIAAIRALCRGADVITPNLTEAFLLLGKDYDHTPLTSGAATSMLARLSEQGPGRVVITGVTLATGEYANIGYDREHNAYWKASGDYVPASYPGTGDIFASVLTGSFMMGDSLPMALDRATRYTELTIKTTFGFSTDSREGVMLERTLEWLTHREVPQRYRPL